MRTSLLSLLFLFIGFVSHAQDKITASLNEVTVFYTGAEMTHQANHALKSGNNEIYIQNLSPFIDINSLKIKTSNGVIVSSFEFSKDYLKENTSFSKIENRLKDSLDHYELQLSMLKKDIEVNKEVNDFLSKGIVKNVSGSENGMDMEEMTDILNYYREESKKLFGEKQSFSKQEKALKDKIDALKKQLQQESLKNNKLSGILKLNLASPLAANCLFTISYYTPNAGWEPYYDVNVVSTDQPIKFIEKAKVAQTTGLDWDKVTLTLSTSTPSNGKEAPLFNAWFLNFAQPTGKFKNNTLESALQGRTAGVQVSADSSKAIRIRGAVSLSDDDQPLYVINGVPASSTMLSQIDHDDILSMEIIKDASTSALYGSRAANGVVLITTNKGVTQSTIDDYIVQAETDLNREFRIDKPYFIPGNGKVQNIPLNEKEAVAEYKYYCVPKLDKEIYLLAEISNWEKLNLLSGSANVTYDGNYIGETVINTSSTHEKLSLTLGTDSRISVKREKMQDFSSTKILGSDVKQTFTYKITVRNNQTKPIKLVLKDQYPISTQKEIDVELHKKETTSWTQHAEELGVITWEGEIGSGETKNYQISYSVKYPKNRKLTW
jgi:TonB-dependent SusC/RagA subfamily outer membrane receptor